VTALRCLLTLALLAFAAAPAAAQTETVEYYGLDALGSVRVIFDQNGQPLERMDYGPFGENLKSAIKMSFEQFAQLARDGEAGQDYAQARSYTSAVGRFNQPDPVYAGMIDPQQWNRYAYALNNPTAFVDANGLMAQGIRKCTYSETQVEFHIMGSMSCTEYLFNWEPSGGGGTGTGGSWGTEENDGVGRGRPRRPGSAQPGTSGQPGTGGTAGTGTNPPNSTPNSNPETTPTVGTATEPSTSSCWSSNFKFAMRAANMSLLDVFQIDIVPQWMKSAPGVPHTPAKAAATATGLAGAFARTAGLVTPMDAARSFITNGGWTGAVLGPRGTLIAAGVNTAGAAVAGFGAYEIGAAIGAAADATGQTIAGNCR
jgi:RHS repeat-associated protein